jgi:hypothetical protein
MYRQRAALFGIHVRSGPVKAATTYRATIARNNWPPCPFLLNDAGFHCSSPHERTRQEGGQRGRYDAIKHEHTSVVGTGSVAGLGLQRRAFFGRMLLVAMSALKMGNIVAGVALYVTLDVDDEFTGVGSDHPT